MSTAAIIYVLLIIAGLCHESYKHGKPKEGTHNFWTTLISSLIVLGLLSWGGFFN